MEQRIEVSANWDSISQLITFADEVSIAMAISEDQDYVMRLVIEEIATNIIKYGYEESSSGVIQFICTKKDDNQLHMTIRDQGRPFDPRDSPEPDLCDDVRGRSIGGLGLFLVLEFSDYLSYHHDAASGWNELLVVKGK